MKHVGIVGAQAPVQPAHDPLGVSGAWIVALSLPAVGIVYQLATVICGVGDPRQHQLLAVAETGAAGCLALRLGQGGQQQAGQDGDDRDDNQQFDERERLFRFFFHSEKFKTPCQPATNAVGRQAILLGVLSLPPCPKGNDSSLRLEIKRPPNPEQLNLVILGDADTKVVIQYSDDLMFWEAIGGEIPLQEGKFTLSILADGKQLFYRVLKPGE